MKHLLLILLLALFISVDMSAQQRGDLISSELIADWSPEEQKAYVSAALGLDNEEADIPIDPNLANALISVIVDVLYPYDVKIYKIRYYSEDVHGNLVETTGAISVPQNNHGKSMIILGHGHIYDREDVFSNLNAAGGGALYAMTYSALDYIVVQPDYIGNADGDGREKTFNHIEGGASMVDMYRAALTFTDNLGDIRNNQVFVGGYSQGGGNAMQTIKYIQENNLGSELPIEFAYFGGGPYDFSNTTFNYSINLTYHNEPEYYFLYLRGAKDAGYNVYDDPYDVVAPAYHDAWTYFEENDAIIKSDLSNYPREMFADGFFEDMLAPNSAARQYAESLDNYNWYNDLPIVMTYSTADTEVPYQNATVARDAMRGKFPWYLWWKKSKIQAWNMGDVGHVECGVYNLLSSIPTFATRRNTWNTLNPWFYFKSPGSSTLVDNTDGIIVRPESLSPGFSSEMEIDHVSINSISSKNESDLSSSTRSHDKNLATLSPGIYLVEYTSNGQDLSTLYHKKELEIIRPTGDYYPISYNNGNWALDVTHLDEQITDIRVYNSDYDLIHIYSDVDSDVFALDHLTNGENIIEVNTDIQSYHLSLENDSRSITSSRELDIFQLSPGNLSITADQNILAASLYTVDGRLLTSKVIDSQSATQTLSLPHPVMDGILITSLKLSDGSTVSKRVMVHK